MNKNINIYLGKKYQFSKELINDMYKNIKKLEDEKNQLINKKPLWFQKFKIDIYNQRIAIIDKKINFYLLQIEKELSTM